MMQACSFKSRQLSAGQYVLALHRPEDRVAMLVRNRSRQQTTQRILLAEDIASASFQDWLGQQNRAGADIFIGMNPLCPGSFARTKASVLEIRHVYLDLDEDAAASLRAIRTSGDTPVPNFVLDTSPEKNQIVWRVEGLDQSQAEVLLRSLAVQFNGDTAATDISRVLRLPGFANRKYSCELAKRLNVPETWVRSRTNSKRTSDPIPHFRLGRYVRFPWGSEELRDWLERQLVSTNRAGH